MSKWLVCGGRLYRDASQLDRVLSAAVERLDLDAIVQGGQVTIDPETNEKYGADHLAKQWALDHKLQCETFYADWNGLGKAAGPLRNQKMLDEAKPVGCIAFPGGRGTYDMVRRVRAAGLPVHEISPR